jgi:hypothetical protein
MKQQATAALRDFLIQHYHLDSRNSPGLLTDAQADLLGVFASPESNGHLASNGNGNGHLAGNDYLNPNGTGNGYLARRRRDGPPLRAVFIDRAPTPGSNRHFSDVSPLLSAFSRAGVEVEVVNDFSGTVGEQLGRYVGVDVMIGLHGAGLTNAMFGNKGTGQRS